MSTTSPCVHEISDAFVADYAALDPNTASFVGISGFEHELTDLSPEGCQERADLTARAVREVEASAPADDSEHAAKAVFLERNRLALELHESGLDLSLLNGISSPVQELRVAFDLMPTETTEHWQAIAARLAKVPTSLAGLRTSLTKAAADGNIAAVRQVDKAIGQCENWSGGTGNQPFFAALVAGAEVGDGLRAELVAGAEAAGKGYADLAAFLRAELAPQAPVKDAVGEEEYRLKSRFFTGAALDLAECYEWGWTEFLRIEAEMKQVADRIKPGATPAEAAALLDADPRYQLNGQDALRDWMQTLSDKALSDMRGVHFDIPDALMALDCKIAPPGGSVGAYYVGPSDDLSRAGAMWWSVPADRESFSTWRETTTVYHEGVPGHHLQIATAVHNADRLNRFQRLMCWVPGHGEGWALYAERLVRELGYLDEDGDLLGMLDAQLFRAARVVLDIGMHLELPIPAGIGFHDGERWTAELGLEFLLTRTLTDPDHVPDEIDRYLGWPGQAPSYKLGEQQWLTARADAQARHGESFDIKAFHRQALELGSMGLDTLRECLAQF